MDMATDSGKASRWVVTVRPADGTVRYYAAHSGRQGQQEWSPRENQAHVFSTQDEAATFAASCERNAEAKKYAVLSVRA